MKRLDGFLAKFQKLTPPDDSVKVELARAIEAATSAKIDKAAIRIAHGVAFIHGSSIMKNAIALRRGEILKLIHEALPKSRTIVRDVR